MKLSKFWTLPRTCFWSGVGVRVALAPFLLQWFHPDERQLLEFAHFHAHGRLHPFLESQLHLRNQTAPWLLSWPIRLADLIGLDQPRAWLFFIHLTIGLISWVLLFKLTQTLRSARGRLLFGWIAAVFWGFPFLYSRGLLEAISFPATAALWLTLQSRRPFLAGLAAAASALLRYPSALWAPGAAIAWVMRERSRSFQALPWAVLGFVGGVIALGLCDWATYGKFLASAPAYWNFNRPGGPVAQMFGDDPLTVYVRFFEFLLTPWLAWPFLLVSAYALFRDRMLLAFITPYLLGHLWTPHREPRFMLPLLPFLLLGIFRAAEAGHFSGLARWFSRQRPSFRRWSWRVIGAHVFLQFLWFPLGIWAQLESAQGVLVRHYRELEKKPANLLAGGDPVVDALVPPNVRWADRECRWHRPSGHDGELPLYVISEAAPDPPCERVNQPAPVDLRSPFLNRVLRIRTAELWRCHPDSLARLCPGGMIPSPPGEPLFSRTL